MIEEEIEKAIRKLKKRKAGEDQIKNEMWIFADKKVKDWLRRIVQKIMRGGKISERWKMGIICPIYKKGDKNDAVNYRRVTLLEYGIQDIRTCTRRETERGSRKIKGTTRDASRI